MWKQEVQTRILFTSPSRRTRIRLRLIFCTLLVWILEWLTWLATEVPLLQISQRRDIVELLEREKLSQTRESNVTPHPSGENVYGVAGTMARTARAYVVENQKDSKEFLWEMSLWDGTAPRYSLKRGAKEELLGRRAGETTSGDLPQWRSGAPRRSRRSASPGAGHLPGSRACPDNGESAGSLPREGTRR